MNPPLIAVTSSVLLKELVGKDQLPDALLTVAHMLGDCAIPMGLVLSGAIMVDFFRQANWSDSVRLVIAAISIRQIALPVIMLLLAVQFSFSANLQTVLVLQAAMPSAVFPIVMVRLFDKDIDTALRVVLSTSVAGIVLIPIWLAIGNWWIGA